MNNLTKKFLSTLLISTIITSGAIRISYAQQNTRSTNSQENTQSRQKTKKSTSILAAILRLLKSPENRLITRGDEVCPIAPGNLGKQTIWSDRPMFIWQANIPESKLNLYSSSANYNYEQDEQLVWSQTIAANSEKINYNGEPLQPGFIYDWEFITSGKQYRSTFVIMTENEREAIERDLVAIENQLKAEKKEHEEIAIALADYLAQKQLWSDVLQQLYTIENPSPDLVSKIEDIQQYFCESSN